MPTSSLLLFTHIGFPSGPSISNPCLPISNCPAWPTSPHVSPRFRHHNLSFAVARISTISRVSALRPADHLLCPSGLCSTVPPSGPQSPCHPPRHPPGIPSPFPPPPAPPSLLPWPCQSWLRRRPLWMVPADHPASLPGSLDGSLRPVTESSAQLPLPQRRPSDVK